MNDAEKLEELKKKLYSKTGELPSMKHARMHEHKISVNREWKDEDVEEDNNPQSVIEKHKVNPLLKGLTIFAVLFIIVAFGIAYYYFNINPNVISNSNIDISVSGPVTISAGQELSLDVNVFNNNPSAIQEPDLIITYPDGTRRADDKITSLITDRIPLADIQAGGTQRTTIKSILLGEEGSTKNINIALEYRMPGTNSLFVKEKSYAIGIGSGAVSISVDSIKEITPEQQTKFTVSVKSNSSDVIKDVVLKAEYPFGFNYISASPDPSSSNDRWRLGDIAPGEIKKIEVNASLFGQANQERTVRFTAGTASQNDPNSIGTAFASFDNSISLKDPFLGADVSLNGKGDQIIVVGSGQLVRGDILWKNNLDVSVHNVSIEAKLSGVIIDRESINAENGFYKSTDDTMYWDKSNDSELEDVAPNKNGKSNFTMKVFDLTNDLASNMRRPEVTLNFTVKGNRLNENKVPEQVTSQATRKIRVQSDLGLITRLYYNDGPFENSGPIPPKVDSETTYTATVQVFNSYNTVKGVIYTAKLPIYVRWLGNISPANSSSTVTYNPESRVITWNAGDVAPGTGYISNPKQMSFQVGFTPSLSQKYSTPLIIGEQRIAGTDSFTNTVVVSSSAELNISTKFDSKYNLNSEKVVGK